MIAEGSLIPGRPHHADPVPGQGIQLRLSKKLTHYVGLRLHRSVRVHVNIFTGHSVNGLSILCQLDIRSPYDLNRIRTETVIQNTSHKGLQRLLKCIVRRLLVPGGTFGILKLYCIPVDSGDGDKMSRLEKRNRRAVNADRMFDLLLQQLYRIIQILIKGKAILLSLSGIPLDLQFMQHGIGRELHECVRILHDAAFPVPIIMCVESGIVQNQFLLRKLRTVRTNILLGHILHSTALKQQLCRTGPAAVPAGLERRHMNIQLYTPRLIQHQLQRLHKLLLLVHGCFSIFLDGFCLLDRLKMGLKIMLLREGQIILICREIVRDLLLISGGPDPGRKRHIGSILIEMRVCLDPCLIIRLYLPRSLLDIKPHQIILGNVCRTVNAGILPEARPFKLPRLLLSLFQLLIRHINRSRQRQSVSGVDAIHDGLILTQGRLQLTEFPCLLSL